MNALSIRFIAPSCGSHHVNWAAGGQYHVVLFTLSTCTQTQGLCWLTRDQNEKDFYRSLFFIAYEEYLKVKFSSFWAGVECISSEHALGFSYGALHRDCGITTVDSCCSVSWSCWSCCELMSNRIIEILPTLAIREPNLNFVDKLSIKMSL